MQETLDKYISHARERAYMQGVERDRLRVKQTAEVFTPTWLVQEALDQLEEDDPALFTDPTRTFLDPSCGDGQFLSEVVIRKIERSGCTLEQALSTTYGVELMQDNADACRTRLAGPDPTQEILSIVAKNIMCTDGLEYHYQFGREKRRALF